MKFIGAGSSRKAYSLGNGRCAKIPIRERFQAGALQNRYEAENLEKYREYSCFPKIYSHSGDYSRIEVEECPGAGDDPLAGSLRGVLSEGEINSAPRFDIYRKVQVDGRYVRWFAFVFGRFMDYVLDNQGQYGTCGDFRSFCDACVRAAEAFRSSADLRRSRGCLTGSSDEETVVSQVMKFLIAFYSCGADPEKESLKDLIEFYVRSGKRGGFMFADLWNSAQWGRRTGGGLVVVDMGYSHELARSCHYSGGKTVPLSDGVTLTEPGSSPGMFNGEPLSGITSPNGAPVNVKFYTKSEYILAEDGMSRHIKHLGLPDDGLWWWADKMTFMPYESLTRLMGAIAEKTGTAVKIRFAENSLSVNAIGPGGRWKECLEVPDVAYEPAIGLHVCEFTFDGFDAGDGSGVLKKFHPGHAVTYIEGSGESLERESA